MVLNALEENFGCCVNKMTTEREKDLFFTSKILECQLLSFTEMGLCMYRCVFFVGLNLLGKLEKNDTHYSLGNICSFCSTIYIYMYIIYNYIY